MYQFCHESDLFKPVSDYFKNQGYNIRGEVKIGFCRADIVAYKKDEVVGVELKISDWKKAIVQAKNYQLGCDYIYLAFPLSKVYNILKKAEHIIKKEGIGLLVISEKDFSVRKIINPEQSNKKMGSLSINNFNHLKFRVTKYKFL
jgi:hypothetical protein